MKKTTISGPELILPSMKANKEMKAYRNEENNDLGSRAEFT